MPIDLLPLFLGTAYAALGLAGLRLYRVDGTGYAWSYLCIAGLTAAFLEWYRLYAPIFLTPQPNDFLGSLLAFASLAGFLEFSRYAITRRYRLHAFAQIIAGLVITVAGIIAIFIAPGGIYNRLIIVQQSVGLSLAGLSLMVIMPFSQAESRYARIGGFALVISIAYALSLSNPWILVAGVGMTAVFLRIVHASRQPESKSLLSIIGIIEFLVIVALLIAACFAANNRGNKIIHLEGLQFLRITETAAAALDTDDISSLTGTPVDHGSQPLADILQRLNAIRRLTHPTARPGTEGHYAYLMRKHDDSAIFLASDPQEEPSPNETLQFYEEASPELLQSLHTGAPFIEGPLADKYGTWVSAFAPIRDRNGTLLALLGIDFDASDWTAIENDARLTSIRNWNLVVIITLLAFTSIGVSLKARGLLLRSETIFRTVANYTDSWEYWLSPKGKMLHVSPACEKITGYKPESFNKHPRQILKITHPDDRKRVAAHLRSCSHDTPTGTFDFKIIRKNGSVAWISHSCQSVYDDKGRWSGRRASNHDITDLRQAELNLARQERLQRGCQQALRRLLGRSGNVNLSDALDTAAQAGNCSCAGIFKLSSNDDLETLQIWPECKEGGFSAIWNAVKDRALTILGVGEIFEILPHETSQFHETIRGSHLVILPLIDRTNLCGIAVFAAPASRPAWSRAELAALATFASGLAITLHNKC